MTKHYCDYCKEEIDNQRYNISFLKHITDCNIGYVQILKDGTNQPVSGVSNQFDLCLKCYNEINYKIWDTIKDKINKI